MTQAFETAVNKIKTQGREVLKGKGVYEMNLPYCGRGYKVARYFPNHNQIQIVSSDGFYDDWYNENSEYVPII